MLRIFLPIILCAFVVAGCCKCGIDNIKEDVPSEILEKSDNFIKAKTGLDFFDAHISKKNLSKTDNGYLIVYNLSLNDETTNEISLYIDNEGKVVEDKEIIGIPDCISNPADCRFDISGEQAISIAKNNGLYEGIRKWDVNFKWNSNHNKYVWEIKSILSEVESGGFIRTTGQTMLINPGDGEVIETSEWMIN